MLTTPTRPPTNVHTRKHHDKVITVSAPPYYVVGADNYFSVSPEDFFLRHVGSCILASFLFIAANESSKSMRTFREVVAERFWPSSFLVHAVYSPYLWTGAGYRGFARRRLRPKSVGATDRNRRSAASRLPACKHPSTAAESRFQVATWRMMQANKCGGRWKRWKTGK